MKVSFLNLDREAARLVGLDLMSDIESVISSGRYLFGPKSEELETRLSEMFGRPVVLVGCGTDAIALSLKAVGIGPGDKVAVPAMSAIPTAIAVKMIGAVPFYVDVDASLTMNPYCLETIAGKHHINAVVPVHLYGNPADMVAIQIICGKYGIPIVEDCAQSFGSVGAGGSLLGCFGATGALSFYPTKNLGAMGDAGAVVACDEKMAESIRELRFYGQQGSHRMGRMPGMNSRVDEIQCTILLKKLAALPEQFDRRKKMKSLYDSIVVGTTVKTPKWRSGAVPHLYPVIVDDRKKVADQFLSRGIETAIHYPFNLIEEVEGRRGAACGWRAKHFSDRILSLPFNPWMTNEEVEWVIQALKEIGR